MTDAEIEKVYDEWIGLIAKSATPEKAIEHFRLHVGEHYLRHEKEGELSLLVWMIGVFNFFRKFMKMYPDITVADMLFKLCRWHKRHTGGVEPPFDIDGFMAEYEGPAKDFDRPLPAKPPMRREGPCRAVRV